MADTSPGFRYRGRKSGGEPTIMKLLFNDTETLTKGDMLNLEADGKVDLAATGDTGLLGVALETLSGVASTTYISVIVDGDAIYGVYDPNARLKGATLDITGITGAQTVTSPVNHDFVVWANSDADEETLVVFNFGNYPDTVAAI